MFGKITYLSDTKAFLENNHGDYLNGDLLNLHVVFETEDSKILGEISEVKDDHIEVNFLGQFIDGVYYSGIIKKANLNSKVRVINSEELASLIGLKNDKTITLGKCASYNDYEISAKVNDLFANHLVILGNSGSGKTCGVARVVQNIFESEYSLFYNANLIFFDSFGEYKNAFKTIKNLNQYYNYKFLTINKKDETDMDIRIPINLLSVDDFAILLQADKHSQLTILTEALKNARLFSSDDETTVKYKNNIIAKAILTILYSNDTIQAKKDNIFSIIDICHTKEFNFDTIIPGVGYTRNFSECLQIDSRGRFGEEVLFTEYILKFIDSKVEYIEPENAFFTLEDLLKALEFTLISEGFLSNENMFNEGELLKVRLKHILQSNIKDIFDGTKHYTYDKFVDDLVVLNNEKAQIININLEQIDDSYAKSIVKIYSRLLFEFSKNNTNRATMPFNLFLEEAHRYIQKDSDVFLLGYNIFERIAKEGRKYGVILDIVSQRPSELSETVLSQCSNFLIFKMTHSTDINYIEEMLPNVSQDIMQKVKILQPGSCVAFGSVFKIPWVCRFKMPNPAPYSSSCDVEACWKSNKAELETNNSQDVVIDQSEIA